MLSLLKLSFDKKSGMYFVWNTIFSILQTLGYIAIPILLGYLNQLGDSNISYNDTLMPWLSLSNQSLILMIIMLVLSLVSFGFGIISIYYSSKIATYLTNNLRVRVFKKAINFSKEDWNIWSKNQILNFVTVDLTYISNAFEFLFRIVYKTIFMYFGSIIGIIIISFSDNTILVLNYPTIPIWSMVVMTIAISLIMFSLIILISYFASKKFTKNQESLDLINEYIEDNINAQKTIKLLNLQEYQFNQFIPLNQNMKKIYTKTGLIQSAILPTIYFFLDVAVVLVTWLTPKTMIAQLSSFLLFIGLILNSMVSCALAIININKGISCSKRIINFLDYQNIISYSNKDILINNYNVKVKNLNYNYHNNFSLNINSFEIKEGQKVGILGLTNSGKTTFLNLLTKQLKSSNNQIQIGNHDLQNLSKKNITEIFAYCPQKPQLFSGSVKTNILFGNRNANDFEIDKVLEKVNLHNFIGKSMNINIGDLGKKISGGQKQRIMIARTLISNSKIQIFDDCFSALDKITQTTIIDRILKDEKSVIMTSQRPTLLKHCDLIYVFKNGEIISCGTHNELMKKCEYYATSFKEVLLD